MAAVTIRIGGRVHGVFFRVSACDKALSLGVVGFVRNEPDGSVYIEAEGGKEILEEFAKWCRIGPARAEVMTFIMDETKEKGYVGFQIRR